MNCTQRIIERTNRRADGNPWVCFCERLFVFDFAISCSGLSDNVFRAVLRKGYRVPTPIQRKVIPLLLDGKDVVAMARTGDEFNTVSR
jgi:superfamily II DNA/RNA helicase